LTGLDVDLHATGQLNRAALSLRTVRGYTHSALNSWYLT